VYDQTLLSDQVVNERYQASIDPETIAANRHPMWERENLEGQLDRLTAPMLIVWGQDDRAAPMDIAFRMLRELPDARLVVFSRCGHWAHVEHEAEFNGLVGTFLAAD
jgi:pimeloyl-ACP methyl ester carboxylesterase